MSMSLGAMIDVIQDHIAEQDEYLYQLAHQIETDRTMKNHIALWFDEEENRYLDECGNVIYNPQILVPPYMLQIFRRQKSYFYGTRHGGNTVIELIWMDPNDPPWKS